MLKNKLIFCVFIFTILFSGCLIDVDDPNVFIWTFQESIVDINGTPWSDYNYAAEFMNTNANIRRGNVNMSLRADANSDSRIAWMPNEPNPYDGFTRGAIQVSGAARPPDGFIQIGRVQGPFEITLRYTGVGAPGAKRPFLRFNDDTPQVNGPDSTGIFDPQTLTFRYERPFPVVVTIGSNDSIKLFDVIITTEMKNY